MAGPRLSWVTYRVWISALIVALLLARGVAPTLRGAAVGLEAWIDGTDLVSAWLTQVVGVAGAFLLIRLLIDALRDAPRRPVSGLAASLGFLPAFVVLVAAEGPVFEPLVRLSLVSTLGLGTLVILTRVIVAPRSALVPAAAVISIACRLIQSLDGQTRIALLSLSYLGAAATLLVVLLIGWKALRRGRVGALAKAASRPEVHRSLVAPCAGAVHLSLTGLIDPGWISIFPSNVALPGLLAVAPLLGLYLTWFPRRPQEAPSDGALLLASVAPVSPLTSVALTLCFLLMHLAGTRRRPL